MQAIFGSPSTYGWVSVVANQEVDPRLLCCWVNLRSSRSPHQIRQIDQDLARDDLLPVLSCAAEEREVGHLVAAAGFGSSGALLDADISAETEMLMVNSRAVL
jgi:hypothetical protein